MFVKQCKNKCFHAILLEKIKKLNELEKEKRSSTSANAQAPISKNSTNTLYIRSVN